MNAHTSLVRASALSVFLTLPTPWVARATTGDAAPIANFALADAGGVDVYLYSRDPAIQATVLVFTAIECPNARLYGPRLVELETEYRPRGVRFLAIDPNLNDTAEELRSREEELGQQFPTLLDPMHVVTGRLGVRRSTEVFLLDRNYTLRYRGAIDDQYGLGVRKPAPHRNYLVDALEAVLAGASVEIADTDPAGCLIGPAAHDAQSSPLTYHRDIAPIVHEHCVGCHRPGQVGPMSFLEPDVTRGYSSMIAEVVENGRMPPWYADRRYGDFANERGLNETDKAMIAAWAAGGAPLGDPDEAPPPPTFDDEGWGIGRPDLVATVPEPYTVPPSGVVPYQYVLIDPGLEEDRWVSAVQIRPSRPEVVHHAMAVPVPAGLSDAEALDPKRRPDFIRDGYFVTYVPGMRPMIYPDGMGKLLKAGTRILVEFHFQPTGAEIVDQSQIGFRFADQPVTHPVLTRGLFFWQLDIKPGDPEARYELTNRLGVPTKILSLFPHMHLRGKSFRFEVLGPDWEVKEVLLDVPNYDPYWQDFYRFAEPYRLEANESLRVSAVFDNSSGNPNNPDPSQRVKWGWQEDQEMMIGYFDWVILDQ